MVIKNIIFDFDGTLGDSKECGIIATQKAFSAHQLTIPGAKTIEYYMGIPIEESFKLMSSRILSETEFNTLLADFRQCYKQYEDKYLKLFPGIKELLETLSHYSFQIFVVSSKHTEVLDRNLSLLGIRNYFTETIGSNKVTKYKPDPEGIDFIVTAHELNRQETLMIGDAIFDLQMGKFAKVKTCAVSWGSHSEDNLRSENPDLLIHCPEELLNTLIY